MWIPQRYADYVYRAEIILENSDTGTELTIESNDIEQPNEVVATDLETTEAKPQAEDTVEYELQLDGEGEPEKTPDDKLESKPDPEMARKAFKEREEKRKRKLEREQRDKAISLELELNKRYRTLKEPDPDDYEWGSQEYLRAAGEYHANLTRIKDIESELEKLGVTEKEQEVQSRTLDAATLIHVDKQEESVRGKYKQYDNDKAELEMKLANAGQNPELAMMAIMDFSAKDGFDFAAAVVALNKVPGAFDSLMSASDKGDPVLVTRELRNAAKKVKFAEKKITSAPEPEVTSKGSTLTGKPLEQYGQFV